LMGPVFPIIISIFTAVFGVICLGSGIIGYLLKATRLFDRLLLFAAAFLLISPGVTTDLIGFLCIGMAVVLQVKTGTPAVTVEAKM
jgi:TRAP-type uncharacterized transport system fused permease subunit